MITPALLLGLGLITLIHPRLLAFSSARVRRERLAEIDRGAPEAYFEERRALVDHVPSPRFLLLWRILGGVIVLGSALALIERSGVAG